MKDGGVALEVDAGKRAFAETDARGGGVVVGADAKKLGEELAEIGVVADDENVFTGGGIAQKALELGEGRARSEGVGDEDLLFVSGLGGDELGGLLGALERAGDDEIEVELEGVEDVGELQALGLAVLVEGTLDVENWIGAADAGAGVAKDE